jgi:hypothetical protein
MIGPLRALRSSVLGLDRCMLTGYCSSIHTSSSSLRELRITPKTLREPVSDSILNFSKQVGSFISDYDGRNTPKQFPLQDNLVPVFEEKNAVPLMDSLTDRDGEIPIRTDVMDPRLKEVSQLISQKEFFEAVDKLEKLFDEDQTVLHRLGNSECSSLIRIAPFWSDLAPESWRRLKMLIQMMQRHSNHQLLSGDYSRLITVAFCARDPGAVQSLWDEARIKGIPRSIELWNAYITSSCNAYPPMWTELLTGRMKKLRRDFPAPVPVANAVDLLSEMIQDGIAPDAETYERLILYLAQDKMVDNVRITVKSIWGIEVTRDDNLPDQKLDFGKQKPEIDVYQLINKDLPSDFSLDKDFKPGVPLYPTWKTLENIFIAFAVNDEVEEGMKTVFKMARAYGISLTASTSSRLWDSIFRWTYHNCVKGKAPLSLFRQLYSAYSATYQGALWGRPLKLMISHLVSGGYFREAEELLPLLIEVSQKDANLCLKALTKAMLDMGFAEQAFKVLDRWGPVHPDFENIRQRQINYANSRKWVATAIKKRREIVVAGQTQSEGSNVANEMESVDGEVPVLSMR